MTRKEKEVLDILTGSIYVVVRGRYYAHENGMLDFIVEDVLPGRHTFEECDKIIIEQTGKIRESTIKISRENKSKGLNKRKMEEYNRLCNIAFNIFHYKSPSLKSR